MTQVLALDLGTATGWACSRMGTLTASGTWKYKPGRFAGGGMRYLEFRRWLDEMDKACGGIVALYFEEVRGHKGVDAAHAYGGFMATLTSWCEERRKPYLGVPVGTIKQFATGKGNSNKEAMMLAAHTLWGVKPADDNEGDALCLLRYVEDVLGGQQVPQPARKRITNPRFIHEQPGRWQDTRTSKLDGQSGRMPDAPSKGATLLAVGQRNVRGRVSATAAKVLHLRHRA